jgi:hypothetical protein
VKRNIGASVNDRTELFPSSLNPLVVRTHYSASTDRIVRLIAGKGFVTGLVEEDEEPVIGISQFLNRTFAHENGKR